MVSFEKKTLEREEIPVPEASIDNKLELAIHISKIQSRIKEEISPDFVYARLDEEDKKIIREMTANAYYCKKIIKAVEKSYKVWVWNKEGFWFKKRPEETTILALRQYGNNIFDSFMTKMFMLAILNRNVKDNYLVKHSVGMPDEEEGEVEGFVNKLKEKMKHEKEEK